MSTNDTRSSPPRGPYQPVRKTNMNWLILVVAVVIGGAAWWAMTTHRADVTNPPATTGQTTPVTPTPQPRPTTL
jgi:hypothetical protein